MINFGTLKQRARRHETISLKRKKNILDQFDSTALEYVFFNLGFCLPQSEEAGRDSSKHVVGVEER